MKKLFISCFFLIIYLSLFNNILSQNCYPAIPISPDYYTSVDPPVFRILPAYGSYCGYVNFGNQLTELCPITFQHPPNNVFGDVNPGDTCLLLSNWAWNTFFTPNISYCWATHTENSGLVWQNGGNSIIRLPAALPVVTLISPTNGAVNVLPTPLMDWSHLDDANSYTLRIYTDAFCINTIFDSTTNVDYLTIPSRKLWGFTKYYWRVKPYKTGGEGPFSDPYYFTTGVAPGPSLISPANGSTVYTTTPFLDWDSIPGTSYYHVMVTPRNPPYAPSIDSMGVLTSNFTIPPGKLTPGNQYDWAVREYHSGGFSDWSSWWNFTVAPALNAPDLISPQNGVENLNTTLQVIWNKSQFATSYRVQISTDLLFNQLVVNDSTLTDTTMTVSGLLNFTNYWWRINAKNGIGVSPYSDIWGFKTIGSPSQVILNNPQNNSINQPTNIAFNWFKSIESILNSLLKKKFEWSSLGMRSNIISRTDSINAYWFEMVTDTNSMAGLIRDTTVVDTTKTLSGLAYSLKYFWRVKSKNGNGWNQFSSWWNFTTTYMQSGWQIQYEDNSLTNASIYSIFFIDGQTGWALSRPSTGQFSKIYKTTNRGINWNIVSSVQFSYEPNQIRFRDANSGIIPLNGGNEAWTSGDGGLNWIRTWIMEYSFSPFSQWGSLTYGSGGSIYIVGRTNIIDFPPPVDFHSTIIGVGGMGYTFLGNATAMLNKVIYTNNLYYAGDSGIVGYGNSGGYFSVNPNANFTGISFPDSMNGYAVGGSYFYKTTNGCNSWIRLYPTLNGNYRDVYFINKDIGWVSGSDGSNGVIFYTTSGGQYWTLQWEGPGATGEMFFYNQNLGWIVNGNKILTTISGGGPYPPPALISPVNGETGLSVTPTLDWSNVIYTTKYRLRVSQQSNFSSTLIDDSSITESQITISPGVLINGTKYFWQVAAYNDTVWSNFSEVWNFTTRGMPFQVILASPQNNSTIQPTSLTFSWYRTTETLQKPGSLFESKNLTMGKTDNVSMFSKQKFNIDAITNYWFELTTDTITFAGLQRDTLLTDTTKVLSGLNYAVKYYWRVRAKGDLGWGPFSDWWNFTTTTGIPLRVILNSPPDNSTNQHPELTFNWYIAEETLTQPFLQRPLIVKSQRNDLEKIQYNIDAISSYWFELTTDTVTLAGLVRDTLLTDTTKVLSGLNFATTYYWRVRAKGELGWGSFSEWWNFTTVSGLPEQVQLFSPENNSFDLPTNLTFTWYTPLEELLKPFLRKDIKNIIVKNNADAINSYCFELSTDTISLTGLIRDTTISDTTKSLSGLNYYTTYYWRIKAKNENGWGPFSDWWQFTTTDGLPKQVSLYSPENYSSDQPTNITFTWYTPFEILKKTRSQFEIKNNKEKNSVNAISTYWFELTTDPENFTDLIIDTTITDTTKSLSGLNYYTTYYWRIKAKNENGWGTFSDWWQFTTTDGLPKQVSLYSPENYSSDQPTSLIFTWYTPFEILKKTRSQFEIKNNKEKNSVNAISAYWIELTTDPENFTDLIIDTTITDTTKSLNGLNFASTYYWRVKAKNENGWGTFSDWWQFTTTDGLPKQVNLFSPENYSSNQLTSIIFTWYTPLEILLKRQSRFDFRKNTLKNNKDAIGSYWFELTTDPENFTDLIVDSTITDTTKSLTGLNFASTYYWRVRAKNENGWGSFSDWWQFTTTDGFPVNLFSPENYSSDQLTNITFTWYTPFEILKKTRSQFEIKNNKEKNSVNAISTYWFELTTDPENLTDLIIDTTITDTTKSLNGLNFASTYYWRVKAKNENGWGSFSDWWQFTTTDGLPKQVNLFSPENYSSDQLTNITFTWYTPFEILLKRQSRFDFRKNTVKNNKDAIGSYWFELTTDPENFTDLIIDSTITDTTKSLSGLNFLTTYYWRVRAKNENGWGQFSDWWQFTTTDGFPVNLFSPENYSSDQPTNITFTWYTPLEILKKTLSQFEIKNNKEKNSVNAISTYWFELTTDPENLTDLIIDTTITDTTKSLSGLNFLTTYYWRVKAKNENGWGSFSDWWQFTTTGGFPVILCSPENYSVDQPVNLLFSWYKPSEILFKPFLNEIGNRSIMIKNKGNSIDGNKLIQVNSRTRGTVNLKYGINEISAYWFELTTDTSSLANLIQDTILADTTKSVNGLTNSTAYYWRVKAKNEAGWGQFSIWWRFTTIVSAPIPPLLVSPFNNAIGQNISLNLVWNKASLATNYRVQVAADSLFNNLIVNDSTIIDSTKIISGLNPLTYYWWRVNAKNAGGTSSYSPIWKFRTIGVPYSVNLISPPNNATNQLLSITFLWSRAIEQTSPFISKQKKSEIKVNVFAINNYWFDIVTDTISFAGLLSDTTLTDTSKVLGGLNNATIYFWRVRGRNQIGWGSYSSWFNFTTIVSAPAPPLLFNPPDNSIGQDISLTLIWNKSAGAINYRVQVATDSLFTTFIVNDSTLIDSLKILSGLNPLTYYWWRVNAKNIGGTSGYSSVFKFRTVGNPFNVILISPLNNAINQPISLTCLWSKAVEQTSPLFVGKQNINRKDEINGISNYWFDMVTDTVSLSNLLRDSTLTDTLKTLNGLNFQTKYYWRVKAKNQIGWGGFSVWFNFTTADPPAALVNLTVIPGGFYDLNTGHLNLRDTVVVFLVDSATCTKVDSAKVVVDSITYSATPTISFSRAQTGRYYIYVFHRNHIPISSAYTYGITRGSTVSYDFVEESSNTYGNNLIQVSVDPARWGMIPGDANADQYVDALDQTIWITQNGLEGYFPSDFNGDKYVDGLDQTLWIQANGCGSYLPCGFSEFEPGMHQTKVNQGKNKKNTNWNIIPPKNTQEEKRERKL